MTTIKHIRIRLGLTQAAFGAALGCTQGNVGHYEQGQTVPPSMAKKTIELAAMRGIVLTYDDIYGEPKHQQALQATESVAIVV